MKANHNIAIHACAIQYQSLGIMIIGDSGSGKSELVLELINKGCTFIADDLVSIENKDQKIFISNPSNHYALHIRDIGIINVSDITTKIIQKSQLDIVIKLSKLSTLESAALDKKSYSINGIDIPLYTIHSSNSRNLALLIDTIIQKEQSLTQNTQNRLIHEQIAQLQGNLSCKLY